MTEAFSDRQPPPIPEQPGPGPAAMLNSLLLGPVMDGLLQQQRAFSRGFNLVHSHMTAADYDVDPIPPPQTNSNSNAGSLVRAKRRASGTFAAAAAAVAAGLSPLRRPNPTDNNTTDLQADAAAELKQRGFTGTRALAATALSSPRPQPVVVLSEKAKMLRAGGTGEEELIVPTSSSSLAFFSRKKTTSAPSGGVAREPEASGSTTMPSVMPPILVNGDQSDTRSQLGSGYNEYRAATARDHDNPPPASATRDSRQPPRQQQYPRNLGNNNNNHSSSARRLGQEGLTSKPKTVSFDEFGPWFLALNRDIAHRHQVQVRITVELSSCPNTNPDPCSGPSGPVGASPEEQKDRARGFRL